jgi:spore germination protein KB
MTKEVVSDRHAVFMMTLFIFGSTIIIGTGSEAKKDMWLAIIVGMILGILISIMYSRILYLYHGKNVFEVNEIVFGKAIGKILNVFYVWFAFHLSALVINNFSEFISIVGLPDTPRLVPVLFMVALSVWGSKAGLEVIGRLSAPFAIFLIMLIITTVSLSVREMEPNNLRPFLFEGINPVIRGSLTAFTFPFGETVIFLMIFSGLISKKSGYKIFPIAMLITGFFFLAISLRNIMIIGTEELSRNYFPSYTVVARINIGDFIQRIETAVLVAFLLGGFVKVSCCIIAASKGIAKILNFDDHKFLLTPVALASLSFSFITYESIIETVNWVPQVWYIYASIFQVFLPLVTYIGAEFKARSGGSLK